MRRLIPLALVAPAPLLGALTLGVVAAPPAHAACEPGPLRTSLRDAALVVTGRVTAVEEVADRQVYTVTVKRVYTGDARTTLELQGPAAGRACALPVAEGDDWLFLSRGEAKTPVVRADYGSTPLTAEAATVVADVLGSGIRPAPDGGGDAVTLTRLDERTPYGFWQVALPGAVLAAGGLLVLLLARALSRGRGGR